MRKALSSWGRLGSHDHIVVPLQDPGEAAHIVRTSPLPALAYGMGRSYGDVCLNPGGTVWETRHLDRFIAFDEATGCLTCEAGTLLGEIQRAFAPRGWVLPVSPGTQYVTVGGAIANDVHGKNHHVRGTFGEHVTALTLARTSGDVFECGPGTRADWFSATVGGLGLTGVITRATIRLQRVPGPWFETETLPFSTIEGFFDLADQSETAWEYTVAWIDCLAREGRGLFIRARPTATAADRHRDPAAARLAIPFDMPFSALNGLSLRAFNSAYYALKRMAPGRGVQHYTRFLYPLDHIAHWNRLYGRQGFYQYQSVVPHSARLEATREMLENISRSGQGSFLAVLKTFGDRRPAGLLSFPMRGATLALDFANAGARTTALFERLDAIVRGCGGRLYPAKDARMPADLFECSYPALRDFLTFRDPGISSAMSRRLMGY